MRGGPPKQTPTVNRGAPTRPNPPSNNTPSTNQPARTNDARHITREFKYILLKLDNNS